MLRRYILPILVCLGLFAAQIESVTHELEHLPGHGLALQVDNDGPSAVGLPAGSVCLKCLALSHLASALPSHSTPPPVMPQRLAVLAVPQPHSAIIDPPLPHSRGPPTTRC